MDFRFNFSSVPELSGISSTIHTHDFISSQQQSDMSWVELGALAAIVCCALYRYRRYTSKSELQHKTKDSEHGHAIEKVKEACDVAFGEPLPNGGGGNSLKINESRTAMQGREDKEEDDEGQVTPKAPPASVSTLEVPTLQLDGDPGEERRKHPGVVERPQQRQPLQQQRSANPSILMPPPQLPASRTPATPQKPRWPQTLNAISGTNKMSNPSFKSSTSSSLQPPPSPASSLRRPQNNRGSSTLAPTPLGKAAHKPSSKRVMLEPGYSPLDWAALTANPNSNLRGSDLPPYLMSVTPSLLRVQNGRKGRDAWTSYQGKVYNITPYLPFHPGGKGELMRGAGKDSGTLFSEIHPWVNWDGMLGECLVGILVPEGQQQGQGSSNNVLDEMD